MANPQLKEGYTKITHGILEALIKRQALSGQEMRMILFIIRKTYGYGKKDDAISLSQMAKMLGTSKVRCSQVINSLQTKKILTVTENINGLTKKYRFNNDFEQWETVKEKLNRIEKTKETVKEKRKRPLRKNERDR